MKPPVDGPVTSEFLATRTCTGCSPVHHGVDYGVAVGTPVHAAGAGRVVRADASDSYGNVIVLAHRQQGGRGLYTVYAHLSQIGVSEGQAVSDGQVIGLSGNTGHSTGPHLHWEAIAPPAGIGPEDPGFYDKAYKVDPRLQDYTGGGSLAWFAAAVLLISIIAILATL